MSGDVVASRTYLDLFTHMRSSIRTDASVDGADLSYHKCKAHTRPSTTVSELSENDRGCVSRSQDPEHDDDLPTTLVWTYQFLTLVFTYSQKSEDVNNQHDVLEHRHGPATVNVPEVHDESDSPHHH